MGTELGKSGARCAVVLECLEARQMMSASVAKGVTPTHPVAAIYAKPQAVKTSASTDPSAKIGARLPALGVVTCDGVKT